MGKAKLQYKDFQFQVNNLDMLQKEMKNQHWILSKKGLDESCTSRR